MQPSAFRDNAPGTLIDIVSRSGLPGWSFLPDPLPPDLTFDLELVTLAEQAALALGEVNQLGRMLPNPTLLIRPFVRREALASSRIEGTRAEYDQLVIMESTVGDAVPNADIEEVANYVLALETGWSRPPERPFTTGFIMELHQQLLRGVRGQHRHPGQLRNIDVLIGGPGDDFASARFVPPPGGAVRGLLDDLADFIRTPSPIPALVRMGLAHYQFETIHPFEDGNGRLGRLLMPLVLQHWGILDQPLIYLSEYFERNRDRYIDLLLAVSQRAAWRDWIEFTLTAVQTQSADAVRRGHALLTMREQLRQRYQATGSGKTLTLIDALFENPAVSIQRGAEVTGLSYTQASALIRRLVNDGLLNETTGRKRNMVYLAPGILGTILGENYEVRTQDS
jgi:Fic family protein